MAPSSAQLRDSIRVAIRKEKSKTFTDLACRHLAIGEAGSLTNLLHLLGKPNSKSRPGKVIRALVLEYQKGPYRRFAGELLLWTALPAIDEYCQNIGEWLRDDAIQAGFEAVLDCAKNFKPGSMRDSQVFNTLAKNVVECIRQKREAEVREAHLVAICAKGLGGAANDDTER